MAIIRISAAQPDAERSCNRRLALPCVGTRVLTPITKPDLSCPSCVQALDFRGNHYAQSRQTRRDEIDGIVKPCGGAPEVAIGRFRVTDHGIERVDRFVGHGAWNSSGCEP